MPTLFRIGFANTQIFIFVPFLFYHNLQLEISCNLVVNKY